MIVKNGTLPNFYDPNGNLINDDIKTYTWNARNQLTGLTGGGITASFQYDAQGRRIGKTINGTNTNFLYDGLNVIQELTGVTPKANLLPGLNLDEVFSRTEGTNTSYYLTDALNSTRVLTDAAGTIQTVYAYDPFGNTTQSGAANSNSFQYTGRENDGTGLYYYRARYYSPTTQRFISQDPMGFDGGDVNLFAYVRNNPISYVDPLGLYGTNSCSYYDGWCSQTNNQNYYYCTVAPMVCDAFNHIPIAQDWSQCVRQCLQETDNQVCANKDTSCSSGSTGSSGSIGSDKYPTCTAGAHLFCWIKCGNNNGQRPPGLFPFPK